MDCTWQKCSILVQGSGLHLSYSGIYLVLTQPYKQMWFVVLMAFVMGWSGIVSAAVKPAHDWMMSNHAVGSEIRHSATAASWSDIFTRLS